MLNPFAETGAAGSIIGLQEDMGIPIVGDTQGELIPFQRQMYEAQKKLEAEKKEEMQNQAKGGGGRRRNQAAGAGGPTASRSETVRYKSEGGGDEDTLDVI